MGNLIFKGIQQVFASGFTQTNAENGVLYFVRDKATGDADIYFGKKHYGTLNTTQIAGLEASIKQNTDDIAAIEALLGDFSSQMTSNIKTVAQVTKANADAIAELKGDGEGSVAKAVADAKNDLLGDAAEDYNTLGKLEDKIQAVDQKVTNKNVSAEGDDYVTASTEGNKVTVAASESTKASLALADSALQKTDIAEGATKGTISVDGADVAVHGLGSAAYTDSTAYDASGTAATVKTELLGTTKDGDATTIAALNTKIDGVAADAKSYSVVAVTGDELTALGANVKEAYKLVDEDSVKSGEYIKIYKDSALQKVELDDQELVFTYLLATGAEDIVRVDVSNFLAESEFKDGLQVVDHVVSVKKDATSEDFLFVSENGIKLSGVQAAINAGVTSANDYTDAARNNLNAGITGLTKTFNDYTGSTDATLTGLRTDVNIVSGAVANHKTETTEAINTAKEAATAYTYNLVTAETEAREDAIDTLSGAVDTKLTTKLDKATHEAYTAEISSVLSEIKTSLSAITKDAVISVSSSGGTITVTEDEEGAVNVEVNTLAHAESGQDGYVILKNDGGALYGVMYYGGDDAE